MSAEIWWGLTRPVSRPVPASGPRADPDRDRARVLSTIALASVAAGAINVAAHRPATASAPQAHRLQLARSVRGRWPGCYFVTSRRSRQACSQRRQASAQTRQCGMWACRSHSSPQLLQLATQASSSGRTTVAS
jgi:hypothetical protein